MNSAKQVENIQGAVSTRPSNPLIAWLKSIFTAHVLLMVALALTVLGLHDHSDMILKAASSLEIDISNLRGLLKRVLDGHKHFSGRTASGYWARAQNLEFDRTMDEIAALLGWK